ncbi:hypothetical protein [Xanthobacter sp. YC-JY1]|uniref:hypothetical protein n=1 Tax=Xanthobacter sp. YC-JY1 TaxID=2419844 RepID=UPI001F2046B9|nr:hypothetical protein [Xanthobacter sp. YC-JY1]UJX45740.1 hypothetical protein D7006_14195 [Xanthobacter sp. YC-JY1]
MTLAPPRPEGKVATLLAMLAYRRPGGSKTERRFIHEYIDPLGCEIDGYGNRIKRIGDAPILWSCHTDTVHREGGMQRLIISGDTVRAGGASNCLGADCTTGVWLMTEMIKAGVPGLYVFHRDEECGGLGSDFIAHDTPGLLAGIQYAIAFDRRGFNSIVTHQAGGRCCSDEFAQSLAEALAMPELKPDTGGTFTDTANYTDLVPECTNIAVGYLNQHWENETQCLQFAAGLLDALLAADWSKLVAKRVPGQVESHGRNSWGGSRYLGKKSFTDDAYWEEQREPPSRSATIRSVLRDHPDEIADWLEEQGINVAELQYEVWQRGGIVRC